MPRQGSGEGLEQVCRALGDDRTPSTEQAARQIPIFPAAVSLECFGYCSGLGEKVTCRAESRAQIVLAELVEEHAIEVAAQNFVVAVFALFRQ